MSRIIPILCLLSLLACVIVFVIPHGGSHLELHLEHQQQSSAARKRTHGDDDEAGRGAKINVGDLGGGGTEELSSSSSAGPIQPVAQPAMKTMRNNDNVPQRMNSVDGKLLLVDPSSFHRTSHFNASLAFKLRQPLLPPPILQLYSGSVMPLLVPPDKLTGLAEQLRRTAESYYDRNNNNNNKDDDTGAKDSSNNYGIDRPRALDGEEINALCDWREKESNSNVAFALEFARILRDKFPPEKGGALDGSGLHWFLDEGGLIGSSRAGSLRNADDDFDFFLLLPNLHRLCSPLSLTCTPEEFNRFIHDFLMVFHKEGMCINKFSPNPNRFRSNMRLMYSFQLNRGKTADPEKCFEEKKPFAHMHLGIFNEKGEVCTNVWIPSHSSHSKDQLHLDDMLPVSRCRAGPVDVPCPQNITGFLSVRNRGEYRKRSSDGSCLVVKKKWGVERKKRQADTLEALDKCGYNSIVDLLPEFRNSGYKSC